MFKKLLGLSVLTLALSPAAASAATITVNSLSDPGTIGTCTLRQAIGSAGNDAVGMSNCVQGTLGNDDIDFAPSLFAPAGQQTIPLTEAGSFTELQIIGDMTITGPGADELAIVGTGNHRVINVNPTRVATISGLEVTGGDFTNGTADASGGGIVNDGNLTLTHVLVDDNQVTATSPAGATRFARGGGIANNGQLTLDHSVVTGNTAQATHAVDDNQSAIAEGGGIISLGPLHIHYSSIDGNSASATDTGTTPNLPTGQDPIGRGGGVEVQDAFDADHSSFSENEASSSVQGTNQARGDGGGIEIESSLSARLELSTVAGNTTSVLGATPALHHGSGVDVIAGTLNIISSTIAYNGEDPAGTTPGANLNNEAGGGGPGFATLENTIIADPLVSAPADNCFADEQFTSNGHNLEFPAATGTPCYTSTTGDTNADPKLAGSLALNGGSTSSLALLPGSGAIDVGSNAGQTAAFLGQDQRGLTRPVDLSGIANGAGNGTDIGAFEVQCGSQAGASCAVAAPPAGPTGQRAAALKKCKKKHSKKKRKKCKKRANKLPV
jgi:hypothetical protein